MSTGAFRWHRAKGGCFLPVRAVLWTLSRGAHAKLHQGDVAGFLLAEAWKAEPF